MKKIRILIAEDHKLIRETWKTMLNDEENFEVIASCADTAEAISIARKQVPDIVLMDVNILPLNGFQATARLTEGLPGCKVIGLSFHSETFVVQKMFSAGARGYLTKNSDRGEMIDAITRVYKGEIFICAEIKDKGFEFVPISAESDRKIDSLTNKEMQIANYIRQGLRDKEIALKQHISVRTVNAHRYNIFKKLNISSSRMLYAIMNDETGFSRDMQSQ